MGLITALLLSARVFAGGTADTIEAAKEALAARDADRTLSLLTQARHSFPNEDQIIQADMIGEFVYLEGLAPRVFGWERERDLDKFRDALSIYPQLQWNRQILDDKGLRAYFEALRAEVKQREAVPTQVPKNRGLLEAYVDGVLHEANNAVRSGQHLVQVRCPSGQIAGRWFDFKTNINWLRMCNEAVDLSVATPPKEQDMMDLSTPDPRAGPEPLAWTPPAPREKQKFKINVSKKTYFISAGVAGAISVATYIAALSARGAYDDLGNKDLRTKAELAEQRSKTNGLVGVSIGAAAVGGGLAAAGLFSGNF